MLLGGVAVGISRAALEYSVDYARTRVQFGRPIAAFQGVAFQGAEMAMCTDAARLLLWRAASAWDAGDTGWDAAWTAYRKAYAVATQVTADAIQILGGAGYMEDHPLELWMRDAAALAALGDPLMGGALAAPASA
jgi:alkylation response protein AidB-like acyl-CoA dehydrogenase